MKKILKNHTRTLLTFLTVLFLAIILGYFTWGIGYIAYQVSQVNQGALVATSTVDFNIAGAAALDYKGLTP